MGRDGQISPVPFCLTLLGLLALAWGVQIEDTEFRVPMVQPNKGDEYVCTSMELDKLNEHNIVGFTPHGSMKTAHHMLLFGCASPGSNQPAWNCGEMGKPGEKDDGLVRAPVCQEGAQIIYAWALDAPELKLPEGVGFKVGGDSPIKHLVLQVHYMHPMDHPDDSGITLHSTEEEMPRRAGTLLMVTGGKIEGKSSEHFETACEIDESVVLHPFAFRTHTHKHGKLVSGWKVERDEEGQDHWTMIGKKNPQLPQMFYPVEGDIAIEQGDVVAARCSMENEGSEAVRVGATGKDEMCNFYVMYWVEGDKILRDNQCYSQGPPEYYWARDAGLNHIPAEA